MSTNRQNEVIHTTFYSKSLLKENPVIFSNGKNTLFYAYRHYLRESCSLLLEGKSVTLNLVPLQRCALIVPQKCKRWRAVSGTISIDWKKSYFFSLSYLPEEELEVFTFSLLKKRQKTLQEPNIFKVLLQHRDALKYGAILDNSNDPSIWMTCARSPWEYTLCKTSRQLWLNSLNNTSQKKIALSSSVFFWLI